MKTHTCAVRQMLRVDNHTKLGIRKDTKLLKTLARERNNETNDEDVVESELAAIGWP